LLSVIYAPFAAIMPLREALDKEKESRPGPEASLLPPVSTRVASRNRLVIAEIANKEPSCNC
jgi:hypothetical protein